MEYRLEELFDLQMGKTPARNNPRYWGTTDNKWISIADLSKCGKYIKETKEYLSDVAIAESGISQIPANTVIMSFKLSIGKTAITYEPMYSNEAIMSFRDKHFVDLLPEYIYYLLVAHNWDEGTNKAVMGKTLNKATLSKVKVHIHPLEKQEEIVSILNKLTDAIQEHQQQLQKLDELIKSRFIEMFGIINEEVPLSYYIASLNAGKSLASEEESTNKVLKTGAVTYDYFDATQTKNLPRDYEPQENHRVNAGDVIISRMNTAELVGAAAYVWNVPEHIYLPDRLWKAEIKGTANPIFLWQVLIQSSTKENIRRIASGTSGSMKNISKLGLIEIRVVKAPIELQNQFAAFVQQVDKSKVVVQKSLDETQLLFDSLMQKYFG